nr:glycosyltransferase [Aureimonas leprariae]
MLWIYNIFFEEYIHRSNALVRVLHATEDYFTKPEGWAVADPSIRAPLIRVLADVDLLVAVSQGVLDSYVGAGGYKGTTLLLENGCDSKFWLESGAYRFDAPPDDRPVALFQGGINKRLDFPLLIALAKRLPEWRFWFCGNENAQDTGWDELRSLPNVRYFGTQSVEGIAFLARKSSVGLIPFQQDELIRRSLPLKAYEYVACGMPVVSVPIDALAARDDLFSFATDAESFARKLEEVRTSRSDDAAVERRLAAAAFECYENRFTLLNETLQRYAEKRAGRQVFGYRYNVLVLYDDLYSTHVRAITEHLEAFQRYSGHQITFLAATGTILGVDDVDDTIDFGMFDAIVVHYSVRVSIEDHLSKGIARAVAAYDGPKILYIQDEYENTEIARRWIERLKLDTIFTVVPLGEVEKVYPRQRFPDVDFQPTLTGYVPEDVSIDDYVMPLAERPIAIGYRGRRLPHHYGILGQEKYEIGIEVRKRAAPHGLPVNIEVDDSKRIYGRGWYRFLGSCRTTLGTESGSNIFDDDGELKRLSMLYSSWDFATFAEKYLGAHEGKVRMNQISPKIFEAIRLRTALILFEGEYSGVVQPDVHYIPLKRDYSNFDEVVRKVRDVGYLEELTDRAYREIFESGRWSYRAFAEDFSRYLSRRLLGRPPRAFVVSAPVISFHGGKSPTTLWPEVAVHGLASDQVLGVTTKRADVRAAVAGLEGPIHIVSGSEPSTNRARAQDGAFIAAATPSHPRPNDMDSILRPFVPGGYAAALDHAPLPHFVEIDLGALRAVNFIKIEWFDDVNRGIDYFIDVRSSDEESWERIADVEANGMIEPPYPMQPIWIRHVRLTVTKFGGQQRMLIRRIEIEEAAHTE